MNKYSQLLKKLGLSAAALALSATLAVDSASAADESTTDETVEQNVEADTTTEEKTEVLSEEKVTEATTEEAVEEKAPEATQPEQTDRLYGRTSVSSLLNYDHVYFTHKTSKTGNSEVANIRFYTSGDLESENAYNVSSAGKTDASLTYDELRDLVEEKIKEYNARGFFLGELDDNPYDTDYSYYFNRIPSSFLTDGYTPEESERFFGKQSNAESEKEDKVDKQAEQKPEAGKQAEQKPAAPAKEKPADKKSVQSDKQDPKLVAKRKDLLARVEASDLTEGAKKQLIEVINGLKLENVGGAETAFYHYQKRHYEEVERQKTEAGKKDSASKAKANQHDSKWGAFGTEENATRYAVGEFYGNGFKELTSLTQAQRGEIEERLGAAKTMAEFEAIVADAKRMNSGQPQSNQAQLGQAQQQQDGQKQEARGERLPDTATGAWALGAVGLSTILAGLGVKKFKKD